MKTCIICHKEYESTADFWHRSKKNKDGLDNTCKFCKNAGKTLRQRKIITNPQKLETQNIEFQFPEQYRCLNCPKLKERPTNTEWVKYLNKIILNHCLEFMIELPNESIDLIVMDPPYETGSDQIRNDVLFGEETVQELYRILKPDSAVYCFTNFDKYPYFVNLLSKRFTVKTPLTWIKGSTPKYSDMDYSSVMELAIFATKGRHMLRNKKKHNLFHGNPRHEFHPMQKPLDLLRRIIENSSDEEHIVFDPFAGSGSTLVAAKLSNRRFVGCEIDKKWYDQAITRLLECKIGEVGEIIKGVDSSISDHA